MMAQRAKMLSTTRKRLLMLPIAPRNVLLSRDPTQPLKSEEQKLWAKLAEPPDISMTRMIHNDQEKIDEL